MKKIFILTGEPSGDKLASTVISKLKSQNPDIEYLSVGGNHLKKLGIESIFNLDNIFFVPSLPSLAKILPPLTTRAWTSVSYTHLTLPTKRIV